MAQIINPIRPDEIYAMTGEKFRYVVRDIGDWNMDITISVNVAHGVGFANIIGVMGYVRNDADTHKYFISKVKEYYDEEDPGSGAMREDETSPTIIEVNATNIVLRRQDTGFFDNVNFNATSYNRGKLIIMYEE